MALLVLSVRPPWLDQLVDRALIVEDALVPADAIILTVDAIPNAGVDALRLLQAGIASHVAVFGETLDPADDQKREGGWIPDRGIEQRLRELAEIGLTDVTVIHPFVSGTREEAKALAVWCRSHNIHRVIVFTVPDHSRRVRRVLRRVLRDQTEIRVRPAHGSAAHPIFGDGAHLDLPTIIRELAKLGVDVVMHPLG